LLVLLNLWKVALAWVEAGNPTTSGFIPSTTPAIAQAKIKKNSGNQVNPMAVRQPRYSKEEFAQRGDALYESEIRQQVEEGNQSKNLYRFMGSLWCRKTLGW
jgi:hypothetical protein